MAGTITAGKIRSMNNGLGGDGVEDEVEAGGLLAHLTRVSAK